ncbi:MAG: Crp/Fnr family transcriptional regulator [Opitutaceae bacterium]
MTFQPGDVIIEEGATDQKLFLLSNGRLEVTRGTKVVAQIVEPNAIFGEVSSLLGQPRSCGVRALTECQVIQIGDQIFDIIDQSPVLTLSILMTMATRLDETTRQLQICREQAADSQRSLGESNNEESSP